MSVTRYGGRHGHARCSAREALISVLISDDFVYSTGVASPYLPLSPSPMPPAAVTWVMYGWKDDMPLQLQCRVYDGAGCTNFSVLKIWFCAGYRRVRVICVCGVYVRKYGTIFVHVCLLILDLLVIVDSSVARCRIASLYISPSGII